MKHLEEQVTLVSCRTCERSSRIASQHDRFWCGWCGDYTEIALREVSILRTDVAREFEVDGTFIDPENVSLQPLRITAGWKVAYNSGFYEVDPTENTIKWWWIFKSDMMALVHEKRARLLDLSWSDEMNVDGFYRLTLYEGDYRGKVLHTFEGRNRAELVAEIEDILLKVTNGRL